MIVDLPFPHKILWPNGRTRSTNYRAAEFKKHREWAILAAAAAAYESRQAVRLIESPIPITITVSAKPSGPLPDRDNCSAAAKAYLDGIAYKLDINDSHFAAPVVNFASERTGRFIIEIGTEGGLI